jgi:rhomboid protease GluP
MDNGDTAKKVLNLPFFSISIVVVNVLVYLISFYWKPSWYYWGDLNFEQVVVSKEYWRLLTAMFLHADLNHIFNNMLLLFFLGAMIEKEIGHLRYILLYFFSGIGGNGFSLLIKWVTNDRVSSIGASGAVFGLVGVLLALVLFSGRKMPNVTPLRVIMMILLSLYTGLTGQNIDNAGHVGGLLTGFLAGTFMCVIRRRRRVSPQKKIS